MSTGSSTRVTRRGIFPRLRDTRIRAKLALILVVPLIAVLALAVVRLVDVGRRAAEAGRVEKLTELNVDVSALAQLLHGERMAAAAHLAMPAPPNAYTTAVHATDAQIAAYRTHRLQITDAPGAVRDRLTRIDDHLNTLDATRTQVAKREGVGVAEAVSRYGVVITDLIGYGEAVSQLAGDGPVADSLRAAAAFARAKAGTAEQEAVSYTVRVSGDLSVEQRSAFVATQTSQQEALLTYSLVATPEQRAFADDVVTGDAVNLADRTASQLARGVPVPPADIAQAFGAVVDLMRWAQQRLEAQILRQAQAERDAVVRQTVIESTLVLLVLALAIALAIVLARSLNLSLRQLREGALAVANRELPEAVARLRDARNLGEGGADDIVRQISDPVRVPGRDEIGQVAQAFNVVHREAVRIAAEQAALRTSVSMMFLNLARRSQALVDRMIGELDLIERTEEDPKRLAQLFELDHLATRMRRNDENLLVLAGADSSAPRREDALLVDALRAAQSEVELYNRIEFGTVDTDVSIAATAVNDVVRMVAELLDNATRFSPPTTLVVADGRRIRDYVVIQVEDRGLGLSEEQMDSLNRRLAEPPSVDVAAFRLMGLAVVGRLAARYGIRVELRANLDGGTVAQLTLPSTIVVLPYRRAGGQLDGGIAPEHTGALSGSWDSMSNRAATATLPAIATEAAAHPQLPMFPSPRPAGLPGPDFRPTPNRPALPVRVVKAVGAAPTASPGSPPSPGWGAALAAMPPVPAPPPPVVVEERADAPIFVRMQQSWFKNHGVAPEEWGMPTAGYAPPPHSAGPPASPAGPPPVPVRGRISGSASVPGSASVSPAAAVSGSVPIPGASPSVPAVPPSVPGVPLSVPGVPPEAGSAEGDAGTGRNGPIPQPRAAAEDRWRTAADEGWKRAMAAAEPVDAGTTRSGLPKRKPQAQLVPGGVQTGPGNQNRRSPDEVRGLLSAYHRGVQRGRTDGSAETAAFQAKENEQ